MLYVPTVLGRAAAALEQAGKVTGKAACDRLGPLAAGLRRAVAEIAE